VTSKESRHTEPALLKLDVKIRAATAAAKHKLQQHTSVSAQVLRLQHGRACAARPYLKQLESIPREVGGTDVIMTPPQGACCGP